MTLHLHRGAKLKCPYEGCRKSFYKPTLLIDPSTFPRKTYYTCPHCMSKLDIEVDGERVVNLKRLDYRRVLESPAKCAYYSGTVSTPEERATVLEECLLCPKILQCGVRKRSTGFPTT